jgi:hypothetical protein
MLQQMQRQMRSGGGMQEMMKAMMQGQGGDQVDFEEVQRAFFMLFMSSVMRTEMVFRHDVGYGWIGRAGWSWWRWRWRDAQHGGYV